MPSYRVQTVLQICNYTFCKLKAKSYWCYWISNDRVASERTTCRKIKRWLRTLISVMNYVNTSFIQWFRQDQTFYPSEMTGSHLTYASQTLESSALTNMDILTTVPFDCIHHWMLYSIYLIKSLCAERVPSAEAEFGLSKN